MAEKYRSDEDIIAPALIFLPSIFLPTETSPKRNNNSYPQQLVVAANPLAYRRSSAVSLNPLSVHRSESTIDSE
jgi:hypothetical protein